MKLKKIFKRLKYKLYTKHVESIKDYGIKLFLKNLIEDLWYSISLYSVRHRLYRSYEYAKQGYNSVDFDYGCLFSDIVFKLERMSKNIDKYGHAVDSKETARMIQHCADLLKAAHDPSSIDLPVTKKFKDLEKKLEEIEPFIHRDFKKLNNMDHYEMITWYSKKEALDHHEEWTRKSMDLEHTTKRRALKAALNILRRNIYKFWD